MNSRLLIIRYISKMLIFVEKDGDYHWNPGHAFHLIWKSLAVSRQSAHNAYMPIRN